LGGAAPSPAKERAMAVIAQPRTAAPARARVGLGPNSRREERAAYLFLLPWIVGLLAFTLIPLVWAVWISLTDEQLFVPGRFIGLQNYVQIFTADEFFRKSLLVTLRWVILTTPLYLVAGLLLSLVLNQKLRGMRVFRTILYIPAVLSGVAVGIVWLNLFNPDLGAINFFLYELGVENPPYWFQDPDWAMPALAVVGLWGIGGGAVIYLAGLQNIPPHLYEAASIDGAGPVRKFFDITLPMISPTIFFVLITSIIEAFQVFGVVFVIINNAATGGPDNALLFYMLYMWRQGFREGNLAYAAALAWILTTIGLVTVWLLFRLEKRFVYYESQ
jgi:multiple sugar transport system permease protein